MAAVLADIDAWFETEIFAKLAHAKDAPAVVDAMFDAVDGYFRSGQRVCLVGVVGLGSARDPFAAAVADYFSRWIEALRKAIVKRGVGSKTAKLLAEEAVVGSRRDRAVARARRHRHVSAHHRAIAPAVAGSDGLQRSVGRSGQTAKGR